MDIIVCAKQVLDVSEIKIHPETKEPILSGVPKKISDIDKNAVEEAIKIKDKLGGKVTVITAGMTEAVENIKELLAMGADEGILVKTQSQDYYVIAKLLMAAIEKMGTYDLIMCGEASIDQFSGQMGPRIAGLLNIPQITYVKKMEAGKDKITADRDTGDTIVTMESSYPVLLTVTKEINTPRLPSLMQILAASSKPIQEWEGEKLIEKLEDKTITHRVMGLTSERKNRIYQEENLEGSIEKVVNDLFKEGIVG
ncbi:MAG: electron transfer flavoprotein subunit beta/FixA family protein [Candidatus Aminicenantes bacterium]|nr:electron transfer flavoprotein subunit beta/FixA family protein [Candidatus Aminicenantes bacterium]